MPCDYKLYAHNWQTEIRPLILRRAGARPEQNIEASCEWCDSKNHSWERRGNADARHFVKIVLTVAHLDQDRENNDPENLAALCQRCHLNWDRPWHLIARSLTQDRKKHQQLLANINPTEWRNTVKKKRFEHQFNVLLSDEEMAMLSFMETKASTNKSIVTRQAIRYRYLMEIEGVPTCANGRACHVPHMHPVITPNPEGIPS